MLHNLYLCSRLELQHCGNISIQRKNIKPYKASHSLITAYISRQKKDSNKY